jgi:hypothetical protein
VSETPAPETQRLPLPDHLVAKFWPTAFLTDILLRWVTIGLARLDYLPLYAVWILQFVIGAVCIVMAAMHETGTYKKYNLAPKVLFHSDMHSPALAFALFGVLAGALQAYTFTEVKWPWLRIVITVVVTLIYATYMMVLAISADRVVPKHSDDVEHREPETDSNDRMIIHLETERASMQQRVDTYTLESALFGALSFSAFVTIIASEKATLKGAKMFVTDIGRLFEAAVALSADSAVAVAREISEETTLLAAIAAQTLICSAFFLSVIICRLRFNDLLARTDYCIRVATQFNAKEETLHAGVLPLPEIPAHVKTRLGVLRDNISESLALANQAMGSLKPVVTYMAFFRNLGVLAFLVILIASSLWISEVLAILFAALTIVVYAYPLLDRIRDRALLHIQSFRKKSMRFLPAGLGSRAK